MTRVADEAVPKQFCALHGDISMLRRSLHRAARLVPAAHTRVVVAAEHRKWWERELADLPAATPVVQPADRGTAAGVLLPLTVVLRQDPEGVVVVLPADHHVEQEAVLQAAIDQAVAMVRAHPGRLVLLGVTPEDKQDAEYGWIVPGRQELPYGPTRVERFREKPGPAEAEALQAQGALVNSFVLVAEGKALRCLFDARLPALADPFGRWMGGGKSLQRLYGRIPRYDFSRDLLEQAVGSLWVMPVPPCGWNDLGTPERVARCLDFRRATPPAETVPSRPRRGVAAPVDLSRRLAASPVLS
jgi:mannose-1-phosphate guanylyltransferase